MAAPLRPSGHRSLVHACPHGLVCPQVERHASRLGQLLEALELDPRAEEIDRWRGAARAGVRLGGAVHGVVVACSVLGVACDTYLLAGSPRGAAATRRDLPAAMRSRLEPARS
eukprot:scaffold55727_cov63-Phaeocystis_antarctica.AAC.2